MSENPLDDPETRQDFAALIVLALWFGQHPRPTKTTATKATAKKGKKGTEKPKTGTADA